MIAAERKGNVVGVAGARALLERLASPPVSARRPQRGARSRTRPCESVAADPVLLEPRPCDALLRAREPCLGDEVLQLLVVDAREVGMRSRTAGYPSKCGVVKNRPRSSAM